MDLRPFWGHPDPDCAKKLHQDGTALSAILLTACPKKGQSSSRAAVDPLSLRTSGLSSFTPAALRERQVTIITITV